MHVTPNDLRMVRQEGIVLRFALLESMAFVLAEIPSGGSADTSIEQPCVKPHWGFVISGEITIDRDDQRHTILPGSAFHVPAGGPPHRFRAGGAARVAGFEPIGPIVDASDSALAALGLEVLGPETLGAAMLIPPAAAPLLDTKQIDARAWPMSSLLFTQARFGPGSGYTADWCDAPHFGLVTDGRIAIEWENDIEILSAGDVYHCPVGPPGHRLEAADPASIIDLTPIAALAAGERLAPWRIRHRAFAERSIGEASIAVAGLG